jgi:hypothetical protein
MAAAALLTRMSIGPPEAGDGLGHDALPVVGVGQVGHDRRDRGAVAGEALGGLREAPGQVVVGVVRAGGDGDGRALGGEALGHGGADPSAGAGDQRPPPGETGGHARPLSATKPARHSPM